jgi:hypothetical protein
MPTDDQPLREPATFDDMIACVRRELALRKRCYPKWVGEDRMSQQHAEHELACMQAIHDHLMRAAGRLEDKLL